MIRLEVEVEVELELEQGLGLKGARQRRKSLRRLLRLRSEWKPGPRRRVPRPPRRLKNTQRGRRGASSRCRSYLYRWTLDWREHPSVCALCTGPVAQSILSTAPSVFVAVLGTLGVVCVCVCVVWEAHEVFRGETWGGVRGSG